MTDFFYLDNGIKKGPFKLEQLKTERVSPDTLIWHNQRPDWVAAKEEPLIAQLFNYSKPTPPVNVVQPTTTPVNAQWVQHYSQEQGRNYWHNPQTNQSTWENPYPIQVPPQGANPAYSARPAGGNSGIIDQPRQNQESLSMASTGLTLGIIALCTCFFAIPAFIMGPMAIANYRKVKKIYQSDIFRYQSSFRRAKLGNIFAWIALGIGTYAGLIFTVSILGEI